MYFFSIIHRFPDAHWLFMSSYPILYFSDRNSFRYLAISIGIDILRLYNVMFYVGRDCSFYEPPQIEELCVNVASLTCMQCTTGTELGFIVKLILQAFHTYIV